MPKADVISIRNDVLGSLAEIDLTKATSRKDFVRASDLLAKAAIRAAREPDSKTLVAAIETARRCVADDAKTYKDFLDEDLIKDLEGRFEAEQAKLLDFLSGILTPEQMENLKTRLAEPAD